MEMTVQMEKASSVLRKLTIKVAAKTVTNRYEKGLADVQRRAKLKGFRPGHAPLSVIKQYYGDDVRNQVFHDLIDESYRQALRDEKIQAVGRPQIEAPEHKKEGGDFSIKEGQDLSFTATVEVMPEIEVKSYTGISLTEGKAEIKPQDVELAVKNIRDSHAQLIPAESGLAAADGTKTSREIRKGDFVDMTFNGGIVTDKGVEERAGMKGTRMLEVGSDSLIPGFEDNLIGMRTGETRTFRVPFPKDFHDSSVAGKEAEFTVTVNEVKEKKLPEFNDEFAKQLGYQSVEDMNKKLHEMILRDRTEEVERKLRSDLLQALIDKNPFEVPNGLIQAQVRALAQDVAENLRRQGFNDEMIQEALKGETENLKKRADKQVRASLLLEAISKKENITVGQEELDGEIKKVAEAMRVEQPKLVEFYAKNPDRRADLEFRTREDKTVKFLLEKSKIKKEK